MAVFWITTNFKPFDRHIQFAFEKKNCLTVDQLAAEFSDGALVVGDKLWTRDDGDGARAVMSRQRIAISANQVGILQPYNYRTYNDGEASDASE